MRAGTGTALAGTPSTSPSLVDLLATRYGQEESRPARVGTACSSPALTCQVRGRLYRTRMRQIASQEELEELHAAGVGLIYNDFSGLGAGGAQYNVLHAAGCHWVARSNTNVRKLFSDSLAEAIEWLNANRGPENKNWKRCRSCRPTTQAVADPRGASVNTTPRSSSSAPQAYWDVVGASRDHPCVEAWSTVRLPFGASGEIKEFQRALRAAIAELRADEGELLAAVYASENRERVDAENVLFYNIESTAAFARSARGGLRFERSYAPPPPTDTAHRCRPLPPLLDY